MVSQVVSTFVTDLFGVSSPPQDAGDQRLQLDRVNLKVHTPIFDSKIVGTNLFVLLRRYESVPTNYLNLNTG